MILKPTNRMTSATFYDWFDVFKREVSLSPSSSYSFSFLPLFSQLTSLLPSIQKSTKKPGAVIIQGALSGVDFADYLGQNPQISENSLIDFCKNHLVNFDCAAQQVFFHYPSLRLFPLLSFLSKKKKKANKDQRNFGRREGGAY